MRWWLKEDMTLVWHLILLLDSWFMPLSFTCFIIEHKVHTDDNYGYVWVKNKVNVSSKTREREQPAHVHTCWKDGRNMGNLHSHKHIYGKQLSADSPMFSASFTTGKVLLESHKFIIYYYYYLLYCFLLLLIGIACLANLSCM